VCAATISSERKRYQGALIATLSIACVLATRAGDIYDGPNRSEVAFSVEARLYLMTSADKHWAESFLRNANGEKREVSYFVRTDLPLFKDGSKVSDAIYQRIDKPQFYYIADEDIMFNVERQFMIGCGADGFSIHSPKLRNFILCSYPYSPEVPIGRHSDVRRGSMWCTPIPNISVYKTGNRRRRRSSTRG
jgi:hypothetical protein